MSQGVSLPLGFQAAGHACGIKADPHKLDLALFSEWAKAFSWDELGKGGYPGVYVPES